MDARVKRTLIAVCIAALAAGAISCTTGTASKPAGPPLPWHSTLDEALTAAKEKHSPILVDFYTDWCGWCKKMDKETFTDAAVREKLGGYVLLKLDADKFPEVAEKYGVDGYPTTVVLDEDGKMLAKRPGFMPPKDYMAFLDEAKAAKERRPRQNWPRRHLCLHGPLLALPRVVPGLLGYSTTSSSITRRCSCISHRGIRPGEKANRVWRSCHRAGWAANHEEGESD